MSEREISMPIGFSEEGQVVFARLHFDAPLKKEFLVSLRNLLEAIEKELVAMSQDDEQLDDDDDAEETYQQDRAEEEQQIDPRKG